MTEPHRPETVRQRDYDWRLWLEYIATLTGADPIDSAHLPGFVDWLTTHGYTPLTVERYLYGAQAGLRARDVEPGRQHRRAARNQLNAYRIAYRKDNAPHE